MSTATQRRPIDRPMDGPVHGNYEKPTGLLTGLVPDKLKHSAFYPWFLRLTRVLQFVSSTVSLGIFSQRLYKVYRLVNSIKIRRGVSGSFGAVEGILAAAVLYTLITTLLACIKRNSNPGPRWLRWVWVLLDLAFVGAFIAVAVITSPNGGKAGPKHCYSAGRLRNPNNITGSTANSTDDSCNLPWGTFILAIISTLLHAITAAFHEVKERHQRRRLDTAEEEKNLHGGYAGNAAPVGR